MTAPDRIAVAIAELRSAAAVGDDPSRRGPVPLDRFFAETNLTHVALPELTRASVAVYLHREGIPVDDLGNPTDTLAGFVVVAGRVGWAFVKTLDPIGRRRFTAAHELGHFLLHRGSMTGRYLSDTDETIREEADDETSVQMERETNRFAAEVLMPESVCRARAKELRQEHDCCPRMVLAYRLAGELLVSRQAMRYRLSGLGIGDA